MIGAVLCARQGGGLGWPEELVFVQGNPQQSQEGNSRVHTSFIIPLEKQNRTVFILARGFKCGHVSLQLLDLQEASNPL